MKLAVIVTLSLLVAGCSRAPADDPADQAAINSYFARQNAQRAQVAEANRPTTKAELDNERMVSTQSFAREGLEIEALQKRVDQLERRENDRDLREAH